MPPSFFWLRSLLRITLFFALIVALGMYLGYGLEAMAVGAVWLLVVNLWHLHRLNRWLWDDRKRQPPRFSGMWKHAYEGIYALQRRNRKKRKELGILARRFHEGSEALPDAALVVDQNACITWCNRLARIELGIRWPADNGRMVGDVVSDKAFIAYFDSGKHEEPFELTSPINSNKIFECRIMPYGDEHRMLFFRDVTRITQLEQMRKDFVANVSHELRTPLTVLSGYLEMLPTVEDQPKAFVDKAYYEMNTQATRMRSLIEELLVLSRIEASTESAYENLVDVPKVLRQVQVEARAINGEKGHKIFFDVTPDLYVFGIETELRSAFSNLIFNAIHYTPNKSIIEVKWFLQGSQARFVVKDNGEGIAEEHLARLTERFYRVDKARSRKTGGSGLGLSIVKHVLSHHNSKLKISSKVGLGSEFSFTFSPELTQVKNQLGTKISVE